MSAPPASIFVDETKAKGFRFAAVTAADTSGVPAARQALRSLLLPGQRGLHMQSERDQRRRAIVDTILCLGLSAVVYDAGGRGPTERDRRGRCIAALVADIIRADTDAEVVFDLDASLAAFDRQQMLVCTRGAARTIHYGHADRHDELMLAVPDAVAWCWARGGVWRRRIRPVITDVTDV